MSIIDTGGPPPSDPAVAPDTTVVETLTDPLNEYAGHGTFIEGVVRGRAPGAQIEHLKFLVQGGAIQESEMIARLRTALMDSGDGPHVINLSAGGHTRNGFELASLQQLLTDTLRHLTNTDPCRRGGQRRHRRSVLPCCLRLGSRSRVARPR